MTGRAQLVHCGAVALMVALLASTLPGGAQPARKTYRVVALSNRSSRAWSCASRRGC